LTNFKFIKSVQTLIQFAHVIYKLEALFKYLTVNYVLRKLA